MLNDQFLEALRQNYQQVAFQNIKSYQIGPSAIKVVFCGLLPHDNFTKALAHVEVPTLAKVDLTIYVADQANAGVTLPYPTWDWQQVDGYGNIPTDEPAHLIANFTQFTNTFYVLDRRKNTVFYWTQNVNQMPEWERSFPFRYVLHHFWRSNSHLMIIHGGAVGTSDGGVLLTGRGGSGKSTSTLACLDSNLKYAGDDLMLVDTAAKMIYSLYNVAKIEAHQLQRFPYFKPLVYNPQALPQEKAQVFVHDYFPEKTIKQIPLKAMILPKFSGKESTHFESSTPAEALKALAPSTIGLFQEKAVYLKRLTHLSRQVPVFKLHTGTDLVQIPATIVQILGKMS